MKINNNSINITKKISSLPEDGIDCAIYFQQQWNFKDARKKYEELLLENPDDSSALHNLGVLFSVQLLDPVASLPYFEAALNIEPTRLQFWFSYIDALIKSNALDVAEYVLSLASGYGLSDLQIASFERDIRLSRTTVNDLVATVLASAEQLPERLPQPVHAMVPEGEQPRMADLQQLLNIFNQRKYERAAKNATNLLVRFPASASVWRLLAESEKRAGHLQKALEAYRQAALLQPADASAQMLWAEALLAVGQQDEAVSVLQAILRMQPDYAAAHAKMGQIFQMQGALEEALRSFARALRQEPHNPIFLEKFGATLRLQGDQDGALVCFKSAVEASPNSAELHDAYGVTLRNQDRLAGAENAFRTALKINPGYTPALKNLCHLLELHGRFAEAEAGLLRCAEIDNESPESLFEIGRNLVQQKRGKEALAWLRRAIKAKPDYVSAHIMLSAALNETEDPAAAMEEVKRSIQVLPDIPHLHTNLGIIHLSLSRADDAIACFRKALEINPNFSHARSSMLFALSHSTKITPEDLYREHRIYGKLIEQEVKGTEYTTYSNSRVVDRRLKIGFVSADFRNHAVAKFVIPFFEELHKRSEFVTYAYSNHGAVDASMLSIQKNMDVWRTVVNWSDAKLAEKIREDHIDILVDMSGHTAGDRLKVFARHPAPVQMTWLGYPGTTGLKAMDYLVTEKNLLPGRNIYPQFVERIIRLPRGFSFDGKGDLQPISSAPHVENKFITFGSFNRLNKINREVIGLWAQVLRAVPDSRLLMAAMPSSGAPDELLEWFAEEGVTEDRLYFYPRSGFGEYLKLHNQVDFCLDTFPYTGGTTTLHALWMGVPTLTLGGATYPNYQGALMLHQVGLNDYFVAEDKEDFIKKALFLTQNEILLQEVRHELRNYLLNNYENNLKGVVDGFAAAFRRSWETWCSGGGAVHFDVDSQDISFDANLPNYSRYVRK